MAEDLSPEVKAQRQAFGTQGENLYSFAVRLRNVEATDVSMLQRLRVAGLGDAACAPHERSGTVLEFNRQARSLGDAMLAVADSLRVCGIVYGDWCAY